MFISFLVAEDIPGIHYVIEKRHFKLIQEQLDNKKAGIQLILQRAMNGIEASIEYILSPADIVLMDYSMPKGNGDRAILNILGKNPNANISMHSDTDKQVIRDELKKLQENEHNPKWKNIDTSTVDFNSLSKTCKKSEICDLIIAFLERRIEAIKIDASSEGDLTDKTLLNKAALADLTNKISIVESISAEFKVEENKPRVPESPLGHSLNPPESPLGHNLIAHEFLAVSPSSLATTSRGSLSVSDSEAITPTGTAKRRLRHNPKAKFRELNELNKKQGMVDVDTQTDIVETANPAMVDVDTQTDIVEIAKPAMVDADTQTDIVEAAKPVVSFNVGRQTKKSESDERPSFFTPRKELKKPLSKGLVHRQTLAVKRQDDDKQSSGKQYSGKPPSVRQFFPTESVAKRLSGREALVQQQSSRESTRIAFSDKHQEADDKPTQSWFQCGQAV